MRGLLYLLLLWACVPSWAGHAYAQFGDVKYPGTFHHFDYVNPDAPKGGELVLVSPTRLSSFDKYNPFTLKGNAAPGLSGLVFETLLTGTLDEPTTAYGLLAEDVSVSSDKRSVTFRLRAQARFNNGDTVLASDVKYSFDKLTSKEAAPQFRTLYAEVIDAKVIDARTVRFDFARANPELPLIVGNLPVFSQKWGMKEGVSQPLDKIVTNLPIGSGPYKIGRVVFGRDISYDRDPNYWARDVNVRRGLFNFDRITYRLYKDNTAQLEGFKAGEFDFIQSFVAREWARAYAGKAFNTGQLIKRELKHGNAGDFQGFLFNTRLPKFQDVRVREAIGLAMDFEWMNRQLFYNAYQRVRGYFVASDFEATGLPDAAELALLTPLRAQLAPEVFSAPVPMPPRTEIDPASGQTLRDHLRQAKALLAQAGWTYREGALRNAQGEPFTLEFLDNSGAMGRVVTPFAKNLEKLGFVVNYKVIDFAVLQKRLDVFDFEIISNRNVGSESPGTELMERFGSKAAGTEGSGNFMGIQDSAVDALLEKVISSKTRPQLITAVRALDRVLRHGHYAVPHWYGGVHRVAWRNGRFEQPAVTPRYYQPEAWAVSTWWATRDNQATLAAETRGQP
ncbi:ABC transporter substrate-binding protein [Limnohabitans sp. JirII-29]|uniref:extracellular solute-binding protein n=1 Tax=Limnohabitans sp. JirII-29 TaxID=1835756 RepID=UPI000D37EEE9|nr:extracellular solute-binding protein [Limnohabitans sp. JirII-29]PUE28191.1 ABC transporter substrate-binding protein [Limnohabitans sp. JirII-29]